MCGPDTPSSTPRIGARVDFFSSPSSSRDRHLLGNLLFLNPSTPNSQEATHFSFISPSTSPSTSTTPSTLLSRASMVGGGDSSDASNSELDDHVIVFIHQIGDMTKSVHECGLLTQFTLNEKACQMCALNENLSISVGQDGIIGRRVSMMRGGVVLGDGIVGYNC
ncbi:hypothetical protein NEUTE1DRAFT_57728 [Neurospora tetrasperma FGSC 2508]|uniref:Uncharacterized protein n=1 Tax=Neurospora tetrasperma (strain FGSC 2508 / ATCC MYA-4615 / P0657) TaxID=510951 RepID=F8MEU3_NEUT8|nr:uncharacterized protein NEUTE1DRAFT_57728 [Neurospora tetrasperma FGSC 2508]EGO60867.1 hypothetical protein NEUTE1DRAFT_57728 [Neurospora tetrasperma FGSC 2508]EGZ75141.1 hypothetical protein NEUTE2DRAFT_83156 [Neurospora tetrasperma FGSC 2509]